MGASVAATNSEVVTRALVSDGVKIGQTQGLSVQGLTLDATSDVDADSYALAGSAGIVSGSGADARSDIVSATDASIGDGTLIAVSGDLGVNAAGMRN